MKSRRHKILDHPILGYFVLMVFALIFITLGSVIDSGLALFIPGYGTEVTYAGQTVLQASGVGAAIGALVAAGLYKLWFRPAFKGCLQLKGFLTGILMILPVLVIHYIGSIVSWITLGTGSVLIALLKAFAPGFGEEIMFRGMGVANYMRTIKSDKQITAIFWLSSIVFGLSHLVNVRGGGDPLAVGIQAVYAIGIGMILGAVYLRTGNLLPAIIGHMSLDFLEFIRADLSASDGIMMGMGVGDWITIAAAIVGAVLALRLMQKKYYPQIKDVWRQKWSQGGPAQ